METALGASLGLLGRLWGVLARQTPMEAALGACLGRVGALLERFTAVLGLSWEPFGRSLGPLGPTCLGRLEAEKRARERVQGGWFSRGAREERGRAALDTI